MEHQECINFLSGRLQRIIYILESNSYNSLADIMNNLEILMGTFADVINSPSNSNDLDQEMPHAILQCLHFLCGAVDQLDRLNTDQIVTQTRHPIVGTSTGQRGRPKFCIPVETLEYLLDNDFSVPQIAHLLSLSKRTIFRRMSEYDLSVRNLYSDITDEEIDTQVIKVLHQYPNIGYRSICSHLRASGLRVPVSKVRDSSRRVDLDGVVFRKLTSSPIQRRIYSVPGPNYLWHVDGYHKLISWRFVIHGGIDGYSRLPVYLKVNNNNRSQTVLDCFKHAVHEYGVPKRVRSDKGGENIGIAEYMLRAQGCGRGSHITGRSVHNQRIERFWRDLWCGCVNVFYNLFCYMETNNILVPTDELHLQVLHYVFLPRIQRSLDQFCEAFKRRPLRTEHNKSPLQLFIAGQIIHSTIDLQENELQDYGRSQEGVSMSGHTFDPVEVPSTEFPTEQLMMVNPLAESESHGIDIFIRCRDILIANNV
ncbi:hypothetical protein SNE40_010985 [Patella caerulea]|uniref:Integrase catalytic domain-containing protein n=1 Tax=Patella caerulea TaxID=87958 RepID=A0AAN8JX21_PATCE